jgi:hypothetical protein
MVKDPFSDASDAFLKMDDLIGRLLLVSPQDVGERESTLPGSQGKVYEYVITETVVLDGDVTDLIEDIPTVLDGFQFSGQAITAQLKPKVASKGMVLGRLGQKPSQTKGFGKAWVLQPPTDDDKVLARKWIAENADPFAP